MEPRLLTLKQAREILGVSRTTFYLLTRSGELKVLLVRKCKRISREELESYIERLRADA